MEYPTYIYQVPGKYRRDEDACNQRADKIAYCCFEGIAYLGLVYYHVEFIIRKLSEQNTSALTHPSPLSQFTCFKTSFLKYISISGVGA